MFIFHHQFPYFFSHSLFLSTVCLYGRCFSSLSPFFTFFFPIRHHGLYTVTEGLACQWYTFNVKQCLHTSVELSRGLVLPKLKNPLEIFNFALNYHLLWLVLFHCFSLLPCDFNPSCCQTSSLFQTPSVSTRQLQSLFPSQHGSALRLTFLLEYAASLCACMDGVREGQDLPSWNMSRHPREMFFLHWERCLFLVHLPGPWGSRSVLCVSKVTFVFLYCFKKKSKG